MTATNASTITMMAAARATVRMRDVSIRFAVLISRRKITTRQQNGCLTGGKICLKSGKNAFSLLQRGKSG
jgi:hypothetical protein